MASTRGIFSVVLCLGLIAIFTFTLIGRSQQPPQPAAPPIDAPDPRLLEPDPVATGLHTDLVFPFAVQNIAFRPDGAILAGGTGIGSVVFWDISTGNVVRKFAAHQDWAFSVTYTADGSHLFSGGGDNLIQRWSLVGPPDVQPTPVQTLTSHTMDVHGVALTPDGRTLVSGGDDRTVLIWNLADGSVRNTLLGHDRQVTSVAVSPDSRVIASASRDGTARTWTTDTGEPLAILRGHTADVMSVRFSPDGHLIATAGYDGLVMLHRAGDGSTVWSSQGHTGRAFSVAFSPDGQTLASAGDQTVRLWRVSDGESIRVLTPAQAAGVVPADMAFVAFSPDGSLLATSATNGRVYLINAEIDQVVRVLVNPDAEAFEQTQTDLPLTSCNVDLPPLPLNTPAPPADSNP